jgi:hypothetical protein
MEQPSSKPSAQQLLAGLEQDKQNAEDLKTLWQESFPPELLPPPDWELRNAVRRLALSDLMEGIQSYLVKLSKEEFHSTTAGALRYICGTAWKIKEQENPDQEFHPTARRQRNAKLDPDNPAFEGYDPETIQKVIAMEIAGEKRQKRQKGMR